MADYTYWTNALAGNFGPVHDSDPQPGFYRKRTAKAAGYVPVAIWEHEGKILALEDGREAKAPEIWTYVCQYPILEEWYRARMTGLAWPDEDKSVTASLSPPPIGHNNAPTDEAALLKEQIDAASAGVADYALINDDQSAAKAQSLRSRLLELSGQADKVREKQKKPHLEAGKDIDAKFQPLVKAAKAGADAIRDALGAHETRKAREVERIRREQEEARLKAEREAARVRAEAEAAARAAELEGRPTPVVQAPDPVLAPPPPPPMPEQATAIRGAYGRAAAVKVVRVAKVEDYDEATTYFRNNTEYRAVIDKLAQRAVDAGQIVPGVTVTEERKVA